MDSSDDLTQSPEALRDSLAARLRFEARLV
ncbi:MAG: hypothetical protein H6R40_1483, partial [Gemmatimonadetes bacterium]|nr:hypothetical protein [Gemmatimonadota bacterium]